MIIFLLNFYTVVWNKGNVYNIPIFSINKRHFVDIHPDDDFVSPVSDIEVEAMRKSKL